MSHSILQRLYIKTSLSAYELIVQFLEEFENAGKPEEETDGFLNAVINLQDNQMVYVSTYNSKSYIPMEVRKFGIDATHDIFCDEILNEFMCRIFPRFISKTNDDLVFTIRGWLIVLKKDGGLSIDPTRYPKVTKEFENLGCSFTIADFSEVDNLG
jgi:hypothetical protein